MTDAVNPTTYIYEVNLCIESDVFIQNKTWLIEHFHDMVVENNFSSLNLFFIKNVDPIDDNHLRYQKITAQYSLTDYESLQKYFEKQAKKMRSQVYDKLGKHYTVSRRVFELVETFKHPGNTAC